MPVVLLFLVGVLGVVMLAVWQALRRARRADYIRSFALPRGLFDKLRQRHPQLTQKDCQLVAQALRQFFLAYLSSRQHPVSMPSQVADDLWHEFILYTRNYQAFCQRAFGHFMHHTPAAVMGSEKRVNVGLRRCWWHCCRAENIAPRKPTRLPLLFAIDAKLGIAGGYHYVLDCGPLRPAGGGKAVHCGGDFTDAGFDGSLDGLGDRGGGHGADGGTDGGGDAGDAGGGDGGGGCGS
jgi:hypothetical protein